MPRLRPFVEIPQDLRNWTRWSQDQTFLYTIVTVILTTHTAASEDIILVDDDTAGGAVTVTLPLASSSKGVLYYIKKLGTTGTVTVDGNGSELIDGATTKALASQYSSVTIVGDGAAWWIM